MRLVLFVLLLFPASVLAQSLTISGRVVDHETGEPLPFASIGIRDRSLGTVTNLQGEFDFHMSREYRNEMLVVSFLGYELYETPAWTLLEPGGVTVSMRKSATVLQEVVISDTLTGGEILRIALSRIDQNFPSTPYLMEGFYRDVKKVGGTYISLLEAAVKIYDENYAEPRNKLRLRERVALQEVRHSLGYTTKFAAYFDQDNLLEDLLLHNHIRYRTFPEEEVFFSSLNREKNSTHDGHSVFVVTLTRDYFLRVFVDQTDFSILRLEYRFESDSEYARKKGLIGRFAGLDKTIEFRRFNNRMFLNFITMNSRIRWSDDQTGEFRFETGLIQQLLINEVHPDTEERIARTDKMLNYGLQYQQGRYNKEFWENYNVIKDTPLDRQIVADLEKAGALEGFKEE
jgi:hypothetical protein